MQLGQGPHGGALEQGIHQPVGQTFQLGALGGHRAGLQVGAGQPRVGGDRQGGASCGRQPLLKLDRHHHVGQFALAVGGPGVVAPLALQVVKGDAAEVVGPRAHGHDPGALLLLEQGQQGGGEGEVAQVVDGELELVALAGEAPRWRHHAGVVDQQVQAAKLPLHMAGCPSHAGQVGQVQIDQLQAGPGQGQQLLTHGFPAAALATGQQHGGAALGQGPGRFQAQAAIGAGDQGDAAALVGDVGFAPGHGADGLRWGGVDWT